MDPKIKKLSRLINILLVVVVVICLLLIITGLIMQS
jgi:hypothetical protein